MKTYLVTGGAGFIGSNFILYMLKKHTDIAIVNDDALTYAGNLENLSSVEHDDRYSFEHADIRDAAAIDCILAQYDPDVVINFAAESHVDRSISNPSIFVDTNVAGTVNLLNCCRRAWEQKGDTGTAGNAACTSDPYGSKRFLQVSTDEVYGALTLDHEMNPDGSPARPTEVSYFYEDTPLAGHSPYSASKCSADLFVRAYHSTYGFPSVITRCSNNYGPYQFPEKLIPLMIHNALQHKELPVYGDGLNVRDWLYVDDHCKAIDMVAENGRLGEVYNVGGHNERSNIYIVKTIIERLQEVTGDSAINESLIRYISDRKGHDRRYGIDPSKIKAELGWEPDTAYEDGIRATIDWYLAHQDWVDHVCTGVYASYYEQMYTGR